MLERTLDEIARNDQIMSGGEKVFGSVEPEQLYAMCANSFRDWSRWKSVTMTSDRRQSWNSGYACESSKTVEHQLLECLTGHLESEHAGGVDEICGNPVPILSSLLIM